MKKRKMLSLLLLLLLLAGCARDEAPPEHAAEPPGVGGGLRVQPTAPASPEPTEEPEATPTPDPNVDADGNVHYKISFAGDCTLGSDYDVYGAPGSLVELVGSDYDYPFTYAREYFEADDFTLVNLECALTSRTEHKDKVFCFRGPPEYARILSGSGVECAVLANNHSGDYGAAGLEDTKEALSAESVGYVADGGTYLYETPRGLKIGVCAYFSGCPTLKSDVQSLRAAGAQLVIASFHFGEEGYYTPSGSQVYTARAAIDAGADIVFGTHPHVLQRIESYGRGIIYYSLGNFCFGGNRNPKDKDTAIIVQDVALTPSGGLIIGQTEAVPFRLSSEPGYNDYRPMPYEEGSEEYARVLAKLDGSLVPEPIVKTPAPASSQSPLDSASALRRKLRSLPCSSFSAAIRFAGFASETGDCRFAPSE